MSQEAVVSYINGEVEVPNHMVAMVLAYRELYQYLTDPKLAKYVDAAKIENDMNRLFDAMVTIVELGVSPVVVPVVVPVASAKVAPAAAENVHFMPGQPLSKAEAAKLRSGSREFGDKLAKAIR